MGNIDGNGNEDFSKTLVSFFVENQKGAYDATVYRYENGLDEISHLSEIIKVTNPTKQDLRKLKEDLKEVEKRIILYFSNIFSGDITKTAFPIPLTSQIRDELESGIFDNLAAFMIKQDLEKYKLNEIGYFLKITFIKQKDKHIKIGKISIYQDNDLFTQITSNKENE